MQTLYYDGVSYWIEKISNACREYVIGRRHGDYFHANDGTIWVVLPNKSCRKDIRF